MTGGALYFGQGEHNHAKKIMRAIEKNPAFFMPDGRLRFMQINHTHVPELWTRANSGDVEVRVTHEKSCTLRRSGNRRFCDCDPEILYMEADSGDKGQAPS